MSTAQAVIVSTARTPIGKASRGAFNNTHGAVLAGHAIAHAVARSGVEPDEVEDVVLGCGMPEGATGKNIARLSTIRAGLPVTTAATTINRLCSSGLQAIALAAQRVMLDGVPVAVAGGVESISLVQANLNQHHFTEAWLEEHKPALWMPMIETADIVARRYGISRSEQDAYALASEQRTAAAQAGGRLDEEIVPITTTKLVKAELHYTTGEGPINKREWKTLPIDRKNLRRWKKGANILIDSPPKDATIWFVTATDENGALVSSDLDFKTSPWD